MTMFMGFQVVVHNRWAHIAKEWKFNSSVPHNHVVCLRDSLNILWNPVAWVWALLNLKSSLCKLEGNSDLLWFTHFLLLYKGCVLRQHANIKVLCSINRSWPAHIYSAQKQWWSRYGVVLEYNLCWARKLHCKLILILSSLLSIIINMSVIKGKFKFR